MQSDINQLLKIYLGANDEGGYQPIGCDERLRAAFPKDYDRMVNIMSPYLSEDHPPENWAARTLAEEADHFAGKLRAKFPELDARSIKALANRWSYAWR